MKAPAASHYRNIALGAAVFLCTLSNVFAGPFEIAISPSRFVITGKSEQRIGQSFDVHNLGASATEVSIRTLDWTYSEAGEISYFDELLPDSCRSWVKLERKILKVNARAKATFRFQIDVPAEAPRGECRFMIAVEGVEPAHQAVIQKGGASLSLPVSGRIAVPVYVAVNGAQPKLDLKSVGVSKIQGKDVPVVVVSNLGDAHGRLEGSLDATDALKQTVELLPEGTPIMPGQTRSLPLLPRTEPGKKAPEMTVPFNAEGTLDWENGSFKVNAVFK